MICHGSEAPPQALRILTELATCCLGAVEYGPHRCTCWEPEYDVPQSLPRLDVEPATRAKMCADCAFRPDSPERTGDDRYQHSDEDPAGLPSFWCHQGMRRPVRWRHPAGITVDAETDGYEPPVMVRGGESVPYKADGSPGDRCAGWTAHQA